MPRSSRFVPYARRVDYAGHGRHHTRPARRPFAWALSVLRDAVDWAVGDFVSFA